MAEAQLSAGNSAFVDEDYDGALNSFNAAIDLDDTQPLYYAKRAAVHIKLENFSEALADANAAVQLEPENKLGHFRKGQAYFALKDHPAAKAALKLAQKYGETNAQCGVMLAKCHGILGTTPERDKAADDAAAAVTAAAAAAVAATAAAPAAQAPAAPKAELRIKHDWYQTATHVVIDVKIKKVDPADVKVEFHDASVSVDIKLHTGADYNLELDTAYTIDPAACKYRVASMKIEIKLKKKNQVQWPALEGDGLDAGSGPGVQMQAASAVTAKPAGYADTQKWTKVAQDAEKAEKEEKLEGDAALNGLFKQIYGDADEETRRAMNKSFQESGGTVLSTNWKDIGKEKTPIKPPDGMEHKKYG